MADSKWIEGLTATMSFADAARVVLSARLSAVADRLPLAVFHSLDDLEHVHQLRVSTRRAGAAVRVFADCLPTKPQKMISRSLKSIRRAAGAARDWDVFQSHLSERAARAPVKQKAGFDFLLGYGQAQRSNAQASLDGLTELAQGEYQMRTSAAVESLESPEDDDPFRSRAVPLLTTLLHELDAAATQDLNDYEKLHHVRILGKQLRYAMEIFAACFAAEFRETIYPAVEAMQDILGLANDSHVATGRLTDIQTRLEATLPKEWKRCQPAIEALLKMHQRRLTDQKRAFLKWWKQWRDAGLEGRLEAMLG